MARQIVEERQRDVGEIIGQAVSGGTSAYFDELHKGKMRAVEGQKVNEALRHNRATENLSALGVASNVAAENIRDKRERELSEFGQKQLTQRTMATQKNLRNIAREDRESRERIALMNNMADERVAEMKRAIGDGFSSEDANRFSQVYERMDGQFIDDIDQGMMVPKIDKNGEFVPGGGMMRLKGNYPRERYYEFRFGDLYDNMKQDMQAMYQVTPEGIYEGSGEILNSLRNEEQGPQDIKTAKAYLRNYREVIEGEPGGKERVQYLQQEIDKHSKLIAANPRMRPGGVDQDPLVKRYEREAEALGAAGAVVSPPVQAPQLGPSWSDLLNPGMGEGAGAIMDVPVPFQGLNPRFRGR